MFGTVFQLRPKAGHEEAMIDWLKRWRAERGPKVQGYQASYMFKLRDQPGQYIGVAVFDSEENYRKNASDPEQDRWYRELREHLEADPEWNDGDIIESA
jgi:hypothetical protein